MGNIVSIIEGDGVFQYPSKESYYSPSVAYPEYPWGEDTLSSKTNKVYDMIRECIYHMGYDKEHFNTVEWNPFGDIIKEGDTVLVKPNWVEHENSNKKVNDNLRCLVTNPSVVRAIVDYVVIALHGTGKIIIADAPMQRCNLKEMFKIAGYEELFEFYKNHNLKFEIADLRKYHVEEVAHHVFTRPIATENSKGVIVNLDERSVHAEKDVNNPKYKVSEYELSNTEKYHSNGKHSYHINQLPLVADVIINVPKPKTHRLAGMTAACKNFVGITYEKASLPHRVVGDKSIGGDAYQKKSLFKRWMEYCDEKKTHSSVTGKYTQAKLYWFFTKVFYVLGAYSTGDKFRIGSWYGNDTIWRTAIDLNYILTYADKAGNIQEEPQRTIVTIGDMIIAGQKSGPVGPDPKPLGLIMMSNNTLLFDRIICEIMGFNHNKFPAFHNKISLERMGYKNFEELNSEEVFYKHPIVVKDFKAKKSWAFEPHPCWKGYIEL